MSVCLFVFAKKGLDNCWTDMVLKYNIASHKSWEVFTTTLPREIASIIKKIPAHFLLFLFETKFENRGLYFPPPSGAPERIL